MSRTGPPTAERFYMALRHGGPMGQFLASLVVALLRVVFHAGERLGVHVTPNAFFSPVPDTRLLPDALWSSERALAGVDWREAAQIQLLSESTAHIAEVESLSSERGGPLAYRLENPKFGTVDAHIAYSLVRRHRPRRIVEIGSGWSTLVLMAALDANATQGHPGELVACEPYPDERASPVDVVGRWHGIEAVSPLVRTGLRAAP